MTPSIDDRLSAPEFQSRLEAIAEYHARRSGLDPDEVKAHVTLKMLEAARRSPRIAAQSENYLSKLAAWRARNFAAQVRTYEKYIDPETFDSPLAAEPGEDCETYGELIAADDESIEAGIERREAIAEVKRKLAGLTGKQARIIKYLLAHPDSSPGEVAKACRLSPSSVSHLLKRTRAALAEG